MLLKCECCLGGVIGLLISCLYFFVLFVVFVCSCCVLGFCLGIGVGFWVVGGLWRRYCWLWW